MSPRDLRVPTVAELATQVALLPLLDLVLLSLPAGRFALQTVLAEGGPDAN